ncbi:MAG: alpha/beta hydrolase family protein [Actinomycetes bacterium]
MGGAPGRLLIAGLVLTSLVASACTGAGDGTGEAAEPSSPPPSATSPTPTQPSSPPPSPSETASPPAVNSPVSLPALMAKQYDGRGLRLGRVLARTSDYTRRAASYRSGDLRISGIINVPDGNGPFPVLVLLHGYIDPGFYVTGQGLMREQDYLARRGYVVLHVDYRNHAGSDDDPVAERRLRLGYTEDVINAVLAVKRSRLPFLDGERVGLLGRSMGGGVTYNTLVAQPGLVDAAVVFAPVSSRTADNFDRWIRNDRSELAAQIIARYGAPEDSPAFWREVSPRTYFGRVTEPLLIHHGTADESCPIRWTYATYDALQRAGKDGRLFVYDGEHHAFGPQWPLSMRRTVHFLDRHLG